MGAPPGDPAGARIGTVSGPYANIRAATFDTHDVFIALDGEALRLKYRPSTDRNEALQALRRQVALAHL